MALLRRHFRRPGIPSPAPLVRLGAILMRTDPALGMSGRHATPRVLAESGFDFRHPDLSDVVAELAGRR